MNTRTKRERKAEFRRTPAMKTKPWYTVCPLNLGIDEVQAAELGKDHVSYPIPKGRGWRVVKERKVNGNRRWFASWDEACDYVEGMMVIWIDKARQEMARREADLKRFLEDAGR